MRFHVIALLIGAVTACHAAESEKKGGPMQRVKRMMATDATAATATSAGEEEDIQDSWSFDSVLSGARRLINGDHAGILADMSMGKEMQEIFENPEVSYQLLQVFPMFKVLNGVKELSAKPKELFTKADSLSVLESYRNFVSNAIKNMKDMADPVGMATIMQKYSDAMSPVTQNPDGSHRALTEEERRMTELVRRVEEGDPEATGQLHDRIADSLWGNTIDLSEFKGKEPEALKVLREIVMKEEPKVFDLITGEDPLVRKVLSDPSMLFELDTMAT